MKTRILIIIVGAFVTFANPLFGASLGTAFTYQGRLFDGTNAANGSYDLTFSLRDAAAGGTLLAGPATNTAITVTNGLFLVSLDFGAAFDGNGRWVEIGVRTNGTGPFSTLAPRQELKPTP